MRRLMSVATLPQASVIRPTPRATISSYWRLFFQKHLQHLALLAARGTQAHTADPQPRFARIPNFG